MRLSYLAHSCVLQSLADQHGDIMRFLGIGETCDLSSMYLRLQDAGHDVRVFIAEPLCQSTLNGLVQKTNDWRNELEWIRAAGRDGIILFESVSNDSGAESDALRAQGFNVVGGCAFGDKLENDRQFAQSVLRELGLQTASVKEFKDAANAVAYIRAHPARYVLKFNGGDFGAADNYVGQLPDGIDVIAMIDAKLRQLGDEHVSFIVMQHIVGIEMGVGAYFDGQRFFEPACLDWEHKKFFPGDLGELTGEMGTVVTYDRTSVFFSRTLKLTEALLREHGYRGYINLNTIVNDDGIWPLEFTCRFGYPGYSILEPLQVTPWASLFRALTSHEAPAFKTRSGFCLGVVMTTRPFPYVRTHVPEPIGLPIFIDGLNTEIDRLHVHYGEIAKEGEQLVTAGYHGWTMVVTGTGNTIADAQAAAYQRVREVYVPNLRYRNDIGAKLIANEWSEIERLGLLDPL